MPDDIPPDKSSKDRALGSRRWRPTWKSLGAMAALVLVQLVAYQNCGSDFVVKSGANLSSASSSVEALEPQFEASYYTFLKTNCVLCHSGAGPGQGAFASSDSTVAFNAFLLATSNGTDTASKIDANATNAAHAGASYTGSQNTSAITLAAQEWAAAMAGTAGGATTTPVIVTSAKTMAATAVDKDIVFNFATDLSSMSGSALGAGSLTIAVHTALSPNGSPVYYFSNPRLKGGTNSVSLRGLMVRINGQEQTLGSTWSRVSATSAPGVSTVLSTATLIIEYDASTAADTLSMSIDSLSAQ